MLSAGRFRGLGAFAGLLLLLASVTDGGPAAAQDIVAIRIPHLAMLPGERIIAFTLTLTGSTIYSVGPVPGGWWITADNHSCGDSEIEGAIKVGAAALNANVLN